MVFTTRLSGGRGGRNGLEHELRRLGIPQKNGKPNHPQTQGKVERFQQTMKKWLAAQPCQPASLTELQAQLGQFTATYNHQRPHRSLPRRQTPASRLRRPPQGRSRQPRRRHPRPRPHRQDRAVGTVTLRHAGKLHHIGVGRQHAGTEVLILTQDLHIRIIAQATGELLRELTLDPSRDYQPTGRPTRPKKQTP